MSVKGTLYVISAPSGGGKTSLVNSLLSHMSGITVSVSHTTRIARPGEQDRVNYFFVNETEFKAIQQADRFLEHAKVFNHWYGTSRDWVVQQLEQGQDVILEIDWQGARKIKMLMDCVSIFILPPSLTSLASRLKERGQDDQQIIQERMAKAAEEMSHYPEYDYVVINDDFNSALQDLCAIVRAQRLRTLSQQARYGHVFASLIV